MQSSVSLIVARLLWVFPALLLALGLYQIDVGRDIRATLREGVPTTARVTAFESSGRVDVTYDYVSLSVEVDGERIEREKMSLPHAFAPLVEGRQEIEVVVWPGADQEVVIREVGDTHARIATLNGAMALLAALMVGTGVGAWHVYLRRKGDPADRQVVEGAGE